MDNLNRRIDVRPQGNTWSVCDSDKLYGIFETEDSALLAACQLANSKTIEVRVFDYSGRLAVIIHGSPSTNEGRTFALGALGDQ